jgi:hypothetical protein
LVFFDAAAGSPRLPKKKEPDARVGLFRGLQDLQIGEEIVKAGKSISFSVGLMGQEVLSRCN